MRLSGVKLQKAIVDRARAHGYLVAHFRRSSPRPGVWVTAMDGDKGFPDLVLARPGRLIFMEVKGDGDRLSDDQQAWLAALDRAEACVVTPRDWPDRVERILRGP